jgi:hypothetical protein
LKVPFASLEMLDFKTNVIGKLESADFLLAVSQALRGVAREMK